MSRLGVMYALQDDEVQTLLDLPEEERYDYMLEEIEPQLIETDLGYEMDKAWEGIHYCLGKGVWRERNRIAEKIVFSGKVLVDTDSEVMTLKNHKDIKKITKFLQRHDLAKIIRKYFDKIPEEDFSLPKDEECLEYLIQWSSGLREFYENALQNHCQVIFTVDY